MPNPKRRRIQEEFLKAGGANIHRKDPLSPDEQVRRAKKISRKLTGRK